MGNGIWKRLCCSISRERFRERGRWTENRRRGREGEKMMGGRGEWANSREGRMVGRVGEMEGSRGGWAGEGRGWRVAEGKGNSKGRMGR